MTLERSFFYYEYQDEFSAICLGNRGKFTDSNQNSSSEFWLYSIHKKKKKRTQDTNSINMKIHEKILRVERLKCKIDFPEL